MLQLGAQHTSLDYEGRTPLHWAAAEDAAWCVTLLLQDAAVDALDANKSTPLHVAAARGHEEAVRLLVEAGASLELRDKLGQRPVDVVSAKHRVVVDYLAQATRRGVTRVAPRLDRSPLARVALLMLPSILLVRRMRMNCNFRSLVRLCFKSKKNS